MFKKIGLKNFKRFKELEPQALGPITFFVGPNNSGKSSLVLALQIMHAVVRKGELFSIDLAELSPAMGNTLDWSRLIHKGSNTQPSLEFELSIEVGDSQYTFSFVGHGQSTKLEVKSIEMITEPYSLNIERINTVLNCSLAIQESFASSEKQSFLLELYEQDVVAIQSQIDGIDTQLKETENSEKANVEISVNDSLIKQLKAIQKKLATLRPYYLKYIMRKCDTQEDYNKVLEYFEKRENNFREKVNNIQLNDMADEEKVLMATIGNCKNLLDVFISFAPEPEEPSREDFTEHQEDYFNNEDYRNAIKNWTNDLKAYNSFLQGFHSLIYSAEDILSTYRMLQKKQGSKSMAQSLELVKRSNELKKRLSSIQRMQKLAEPNNEESNLLSAELPVCEIDTSDSRLRVSTIMDVVNHVLNEAERMARPSKVKGETNQTKEIREQAKQFGQESMKIRNHFKLNLSKGNEVKVFNNGYLLHLDTINHSIRDGLDTLGVLIDKYYRYHIATDPNHKGQQFVNEWLRKFKIGESLQVIPLQGGMYQLKVVSGDDSRHLSDYGRGTAQLIFLLLSLVVAGEESRDSIGSNIKPLMILEEPEVNLHPSFQSQLCDVLLNFIERYGFQLIVETHSEYIIRRTQVIGLENGLFTEEAFNPFKVIYFDKEKGPYEMKYMPDGKFDQKFGQGFFDVADGLAIEAFKLNLRKPS